MKTKIKSTILSLMILMAMTVVGPAQATTPAGQDELRIHTGNPKQKGESIISVSARWKTDEGLLTGSTSLIIVNGSDSRHPDDGLSVARKVAKAMKVSMIDHHPNMRGLTISVIEDSEDPQILIKNNEGHTFTQFTLRDYTNQKLTADLGGKSFSSKGVTVAIDLVDASAVDFVDAFNPKPKATQSFRATGGGFEFHVGSSNPSTIKTKNQTLEAIEKALASNGGGKFSTSPLFPDEKERDKRNIKAFDGGDVHFVGSAAKSVVLAVNDSSLGVITRIQFPDVKGSSKGASSNVPLIIVLVLLGAVGFYYFSSVRAKNSELSS